MDRTDPRAYVVAGIPAPVLLSDDLNPSDKLVYAAILFCEDEAARPTLDYLSTLTGLYVATVKAATRRLERHGFLLRTLLPGRSGLRLELRIPERLVHRHAGDTHAARRGEGGEI